MRTVGKEPDISYRLSHADRQTPLAERTRARSERHGIEPMVQEGKGQAGRDHVEVPSGVGGHPHMTLALLALGFRVRDKGRVGGKGSAVTVPQIQQIGSLLLRDPQPGAQPIAEQVTRVLRRSEESRIDAWHKATGHDPPPRRLATRCLADTG